LSFLTSINSTEDVLIASKTLNDLKWAFERGDLGKAITYIHGPPGIGKSLTVRLLAREYDYELVEVNASEVTTVGGIKNIIGDSFYGVGLDGRECALFFDECEALKQPNPAHGRQMKKFLSDLGNEATTPIIFCANEDDGVIPQVKKICINHVEMKPHKPNSMVRWAYDMVQKHALDFTVDDFKEAFPDLIKTAEASRGDMRYFTKSVVDGDYSQMEKEKILLVKDVVRWIFSSKNRLKLRQILIEWFYSHPTDKAVNPYNIVQWCEENLYRCMKGSPHLEENINVLRTATRVIGDKEAFASVVASVIPWRARRTLRFPQYYGVMSKMRALKAKREKEKNKRVSKRKRVRSKMEKFKLKNTTSKEEKIEGGLATWFK